MITFGAGSAVSGGAIAPLPLLGFLVQNWGGVVQADSFCPQAWMQSSWRTRCLGPTGSPGSRCLSHPRHPRSSWASVLDPSRVMVVRVEGPGGTAGCVSGPGLGGRGRGQCCSAPFSHCSLLPLSPGAFSLSDEEGPSEESHSPEGLHQASSLPMLVKEASGAGDGVWGSPGAPWGLSMGPHPHNWSSKQKRGSRVGRGYS